MIKSVKIQNFRGLETIEIRNLENYNIFIGNNGSSKTSILESINYTFSPSFLNSKIKYTDYHKGTSENIDIYTELKKSISVELIDGYTTQKIPCNCINLTIKKRKSKKAGKLLSDSFTLDHHFIPDSTVKKTVNGWNVKRGTGTKFKFTTRALNLNNTSSNELPRCFYFGKDRERQLTKGFNSTMVSIIEDLNFKFNREIRKTQDTQAKDEYNKFEGKVLEYSDFIKNEVIKELKLKLKDFNIESLKLSLLDFNTPFDNAYFNIENENINLPTKNLGSGIEMVVALMFLETIASFSKENIIILIDEPELHLHPKYQEQLSNYLQKISLKENVQVIITTHSPIFYKNSLDKDGTKTFITSIDGLGNASLEENTKDSGLLNWFPSWGEINYQAFDYPTIEFHDELFGYIQDNYEKYSLNEMDEFLHSKGIEKNRIWTKEKNGKIERTFNCTISLFIRNKSHHPENQTMKEHTFSQTELLQSINLLIEIIEEN